MQKNNGTLDTLIHWAGPKGSPENVKDDHKWIAKIDRPGYVRWFYDQEELNAYMKANNISPNASSDIIMRAEDQLSNISNNSQSSSGNPFSGVAYSSGIFLSQLKNNLVDKISSGMTNLNTAKQWVENKISNLATEAKRRHEDYVERVNSQEDEGEAKGDLSDWNKVESKNQGNQAQSSSSDSSSSGGSKKKSSGSGKSKSSGKGSASGSSSESSSSSTKKTESSSQKVIDLDKLREKTDDRAHDFVDDLVGSSSKHQNGISTDAELKLERDKRKAKQQKR